MRVTQDDILAAVQIVMQLGEPEIERGREAYPHAVHISGEALQDIQTLRLKIVEQSA